MDAMVSERKLIHAEVRVRSLCSPVPIVGEDMMRMREPGRKSLWCSSIYLSADKRPDAICLVVSAAHAGIVPPLFGIRHICQHVLTALESFIHTL